MARATAARSAANSPSVELTKTRRRWSGGRMAPSLSFSAFTLPPGGSSSKSARDAWVSCVARQNEYSTAAIRAPVGVRDDTPAAPSEHVNPLLPPKTAGADRNHGAPGIDGVTFEAIEAGGIEAFLAQLRDELVARTYRPLRNRRVAIPKRGGKVRVLGIPAIRDRVVQKGRSSSLWSPFFREVGGH